MRKHYSLSGSLSELPRFRSHPRTRAGRGFSLIELIGVMAVMGILASMTVPPILRQIRQAQSGNEEANLNEVARAIVEGIRAEGRIPDPSVTALSSNGWIGVASNYSSLGTSALLLVYPNNTNTQRRFYLSGNFEAWLIGNGFQTPSAGWPANNLPAETQFMLVSSSREDLALPTPLNAADFDRLKAWNKSYVGGFIQVPDLSTPFGPLWQPSADPTKDLGQYLHVKTVDLKPLFCLVQLEDSQSPPTVSTNSAGTGYNGFGPVIINYFGQFRGDQQHQHTNQLRGPRVASWKNTLGCVRQDEWERLVDFEQCCGPRRCWRVHKSIFSRHSKLFGHDKRAGIHV